MKANSQRPGGRGTDLNAAIKTLDLAKTSSILPAKAIFGSVATLLTTIRVCSCSSSTIYSKFTPNQDTMIKELDCVELGLSCAHVCQTLDRGTDGKKRDELSPSVYNAINQLTLSVEQTISISDCPLNSLNLRTVADIQRNLVERSKQNAISRRYYAKDNKKMIATWRLDLDKILQVFRVRSVA